MRLFVDCCEIYPFYTLLPSTTSVGDAPIELTEEEYKDFVTTFQKFIKWQEIFEKSIRGVMK